MISYLSECAICNNKNELFFLTCKNCGNILHKKVSNIDFWKTIYKFLDEPKVAITQVIQSEQKNFSSILLLLGILKLFFIKYFIMQVSEYHSNDIWLGLISLAIPFFLFFIFIKLFSRTNSFIIRTRDFFAVLGYSFFPLSLSLIFLFPVEYSLFGKSLIYLNPSPFSLKPIPAYTLAFVEMILLCFTIYYIYLENLIFINKKIISIFISLSLTLLSLIFII